MLKVVNDEALVALQAFGDSSVEALITDPPAGISFMGKTWDGDKGGREQWIAWMAEIMAECLRVLKPGAQMFICLVAQTKKILLVVDMAKTAKRPCPTTVAMMSVRLQSSIGRVGLVRVAEEKALAKHFMVNLMSKITTKDLTTPAELLASSTAPKLQSVIKAQTIPIPRSRAQSSWNTCSSS